MTLAQLRYVITVSQVGTLSEAAKRLYISQPSLTNAIKELEKELGITIFIRTNKGVILFISFCIFFKLECIKTLCCGSSIITAPGLAQLIL